MVVVLIHGTFAADAEWTQEHSAFCQALVKEFGEQVQIRRFGWSGVNSISHRKQAAHELVKYIEESRRKYKDAPHYLIAHSHGGNIALYAARDLHPGRGVDGVACLATPFLCASPRKIEHLNLDSLSIAVGSLVILFYLWVTFDVKINFTDDLLVILALFIISCKVSDIYLKRLSNHSTSADKIAKAINAHASAKLNLLIVRLVGDEASFALGAAQFFSWLSSFIFAKLSFSLTPPDGEESRRLFKIFSFTAVAKTMDTSICHLVVAIFCTSNLVR